MDVADLDYSLPPECIAQVPLARRDDARLLVDRGAGAPVEHRHIHDLPDLLHEGDIVVVNHTKVLPARLALRRATGGAAEVLLLEQGAVPGTWEALVRPSRKLSPGTPLFVEGRREPIVEVGEDHGEGRRTVRLLPGDGDGDGDGDQDPHDAVPALALLERHGQMPLPPYITAPLGDPDRYQTVYAHTPASAAAPTAGLHLTPDVLAGFAARGIPVLEVELVVGLGTFRPMTVDRVEDHRMHHERYRVSGDVLAACAAARRVVAIGTTTLRALESAAHTGVLEGRTDIFIRRPYPFAVVDVLLTNFHLPRSSLLALVDAFVGDRWRSLYEEALAADYRFLSFGDAMLLERATVEEAA